LSALRLDGPEPLDYRGSLGQAEGAFTVALKVLGGTCYLRTFVHYTTSVVVFKAELRMAAAGGPYGQQCRYVVWRNRFESLSTPIGETPLDLTGRPAALSGVPH
jgi:hypothetical protein